jgi:hypothetical protein
MPRTDSVAPTVDRCLSTAAPTLNTWTHLIGVYDSVSGTATLYVGGTATGTVSHASVWNVTGLVQVGRAWRDDAWMDAWQGRVDAVQLYPRALTTREVTILAGSSTNGLGGIGLGGPGALGDVGTAASFPGPKYFGFHPIQLNNPTTFTIEVWFRTRFNQTRTLVDFGKSVFGNSSPAGSRRIIVSSTGDISFWPSNAVVGVSTTGGGYADGGWHHVAATLDPATGTNLYVDGSLVGTAAYSAPANTTGYWRFGGDTWVANSYADYFVGVLDEFAVYSTALTPLQIAQHYQANR